MNTRRWIIFLIGVFLGWFFLTSLKMGWIKINGIQWGDKSWQPSKSVTGDTTGISQSTERPAKPEQKTIAWRAEMSIRMTGAGPRLINEQNYMILSDDGYMIVLQSKEQYDKCVVGLPVSGPWRRTPEQLQKLLK